jgi:hypothetical protein
MAKGMLGRLALEGKLVPRDIQEAVHLIDRASVWDFDARMQVLQLLAEHPQARVNYPKGVLYDAVEAVELDEPGAIKALIDLKLSANAQFQDRPGACKLIETAVSRGDQTMASAWRIAARTERGRPSDFAMLQDLTGNGRYRRHAKNRGQDQDRTAAPAQGHPRQ